jgi:phytoene synthase
MVPPERRHELDDRFWLGALAVQMIHEASLLHDDVLDDADQRRGAPTINATHGVGAALVKGDHYLTAAYRAAMWTRSTDFLERFITSVERTVAGEVLQGRTVGQQLDLNTYFEAILGKSGELLGASASLGACVLGLDRIDERAQLGLQLGGLYQQVDDLLDYCPAADTGKAPLKDYKQRKWTWVLGLAGIDTWEVGDDAILEKVFGYEDSSVSVAERAITYLQMRRTALLKKVGELTPGYELLSAIVDEWIGAARAGVELQLAAGAGPSPNRQPSATRSEEAAVVEAASQLGGPEEWRRYFKTHARTFCFASGLFPTAERLKVEALYAYCRFTDDLVDEPGEDLSPDVLGQRLDVWRELSRSAFDGKSAGIALLDAVMGDAARVGVDWLYPSALLDGVAMDLRPAGYANWKELERYTFCVAGAVGGWMTHLFGIRDPGTLSRAHALGHAMQITNILRDVGEDLWMDRVYLPQALLDKHGITVADLSGWQQSEGPLPERYSEAMREVMAIADAHYDRALPAIRSLPPFFRRPVAVAAAAYRGIHDEVRRNDFDNLRLRARTSTPRKAWLGALGLIRCSRAPTVYSVTEEGLAI